MRRSWFGCRVVVLRHVMSSAHQPLSLQHTEALARFDLLDVTAYDVASTSTAATRPSARSRPSGSPRAGGPTFVDLKPAPRATRSGSTARRSTSTCSTAAGCRSETVAGEQRAGGRRGDAVPQRRRGPAPQRRPGRRPALRLRHVVHGRGARASSPASTSPTSRRRTPSTSPRPPTGSSSATPRASQVEPGSLGARARPSRCRRTSSPSSPGPTTWSATSTTASRSACSRARSASPRDLDADADELFTMTRQCFDEFHRLFGIRYPFGDYHQAFVPEFNAGAMENPGCVTFRDPLIFSSRVTRGVAHPAGDHGRARDGAPVVRQHRHPEVVGRPVAQRVLRRVHGQPGHRRRHRVRRRLDAQRLRPTPVGPGRRPAAQHAPGRRQRRGRRRAPRCRTSTASPTPRARASSSSSTRRLGDEVFFAGVSRPLHEAPLRQRHHARPLRELGAGRGGRPDVVHQQLAAHRRAGPDRARPRGRRDAAYPAGGPPRRPRPHAWAWPPRPPARRWWTIAVTVDGPQSRRSTPATVAVVLDPYEDTWARHPPDAETTAALPDAAAGDRRHRWPRRRSGTTSAAPSTTPPSTRRTCSTWSRPGCRSRTATTRSFYTMPLGGLRRSLPLASRPRRRAAPRRTRSPSAGSPARHAGSTLQLAALQSRSPAADDEACCGTGWPRGTRCPTASTSTSTCAGGSWCGSPCSARRDRDELAAALGRGADRALAGRAREGHGLAARRRGQGLGLGAVHRRGRGAQLRARGGRARHVAGRPGAPHRRRTSPATSPRCPAPSRCAAAGCWPRRPTCFFPRCVGDRGHRRQGARADRPRGARLTIRRELVDLTDDLERRLAIRQAYPAR